MADEIDLSGLSQLEFRHVHRLDQVCLPEPPYTSLLINDRGCSGIWVNKVYHTIREFNLAGYYWYADIKKLLE